MDEVISMANEIVISRLKHILCFIIHFGHQWKLSSSTVAYPLKPIYRCRYCNKEKK